ncbi:MAG: hypothetical protein AB7P69_29390, partial [Candidatus Binatia bacterium]
MVFSAGCEGLEGEETNDVALPSQLFSLVTPPFLKPSTQNLISLVQSANNRSRLILPTPSHNQ